MSKITAGTVVMKPRWYFVVGSVLMSLSLVGVSIFAIFLINLCLFLARPHGPMGEYKFQLMLSSFPWWIPILAIVGVVSGIGLLRKYDFSYKKNFGLVSLVFIVALFAAAVSINVFGLNDTWFRQGPMRKFYQQLDVQQENYHRGGGMMRERGGSL